MNCRNKKRKKYDGLYLRGKTWWMCFDGRRRSCETSDRELAEAILAKARVLRAEGKYLDVDTAQRHAYEEMIQRAFDEHFNTLESSTVERYKNIRNHLNPFFSGMTLAEIDSDIILNYIEYRKKQGCKPATRNREVGLLSKAFNLAKRWKWTKENPCELVDREDEKNKHSGRALTPKEELKLLKAAKSYLNGQLSDMIIVYLNTGCRRGEILNLKWSGVDFKNKTITVYNEKANRDKIIPMNHTVYDLLQRKSKVMSISGYVFHTANNTPISPWNFYREFKKALKKAEIQNFRPHDLRHTAGTRLVQSGADLYSVATILDHTQLSTTQRYAKHNPDSVRKHVEKLDDFAVTGQ